MQGRHALLFPKCEVAEQAVYCWHDIIKNRIQSFSDSFLERWLDEAVNMKRFEEALNFVLEDLEGFSPARAIPGLSPFELMQELVRRDLIARLTKEFERDFSVTGMRERLRAVVPPLLLVLSQYKESRENSDRKALLSQLRETAKAVRAEFEALPRGFWLPAR